MHNQVLMLFIVTKLFMALRWVRQIEVLWITHTWVY